MRRFLQEFKLYTTLPNLPDEYRQNFGDFFKAQLEPQLEGLLKSTIHSTITSNDRDDPRKIENW